MFCRKCNEMLEIVMMNPEDTNVIAVESPTQYHPISIK